MAQLSVGRVVPDDIGIRAATDADAPAIAALLADLGYPAESGAIPERLAALASHPGTLAIVAELDGDVVGLATCHVYPALHRVEPVAWLTSLVTAELARRRGVGGALVASVERWATSRGATRLSLTSATKRTDAHEFYERRGYEKTGIRLGRALS